MVSIYINLPEDSSASELLRKVGVHWGNLNARSTRMREEVHDDRQTGVVAVLGKSLCKLAVINDFFDFAFDIIWWGTGWRQHFHMSSLFDSLNEVLLFKAGHAFGTSVRQDSAPCGFSFEGWFSWGESMSRYGQDSGNRQQQCNG